MKVSNYLPKFYKNNVEMYNIISSEETELENNLKQDIKNAFDNTFAKISNLDGIKRYENLLDIQSTSTDIEYRRANILSKLGTSGNLTYKWLDNNLKNLVGEGNYQIVLENNIYKISINVSSVFEDTASKLYNIYRPIIPANMQLVVNLFDNVNTTMYISNIWHEGDTILIKGEV